MQSYIQFIPHNNLTNNKFENMCHDKMISLDMFGELIKKANWKIYQRNLNLLAEKSPNLTKYTLGYFYDDYYLEFVDIFFHHNLPLDDLKSCNLTQDNINLIKYDIAGLYCCYIESNYIKTIEYYTQVIEYCEKSNFSGKIKSNPINNLGLYYYDIKLDYFKAFGYFTIGSTYSNPISMYNLGSYYQLIKLDYTKAIEYYIKSIDFGFSQSIEQLEQIHGLKFDFNINSCDEILLLKKYLKIIDKKICKNIVNISEKNSKNTLSILEKYPSNSVKLDLSKNNIKGVLDLSSFSKLENLNCSRKPFFI
jgi:hypothetical protein